MDKITFEQDETYLPITMQQFEDLTNEILIKLNTLFPADPDPDAPKALDAEYAAQVLMSAIHALDHKHGIVKKSDLFESCVNRVSCHVTYHAIQEIQRKLKEKSGLKVVDNTDNDQGMPEGVVGV